MDFNNFKGAVIAAAKEQGINEYELYYRVSESTNVETFKHEIKEFSNSLDGGVCFRCIVDGKMGYASTEELSAEQAVSVVRRAADNAKILETEDKVFLGKGGEDYETLCLSLYALPTVQEMTDSVLKGDKLLYDEDSSVTDGSAAAVSSGKECIAIYNSNGLDLNYENNISLFIAAPVVTDGKEMTNSFDVKAGPLSELEIDKIVSKSVADAKSKLDADVAPTGAYPVVFSPDAMTSLLATFSGIFSSEKTQKGLSRLAGKEGEKIAADIVTLVDDPFYKDSTMPINFDAEGSPTHTKNVIENGVLKTLLYNLKTADAAGKKSTGNASKASYNSKVDISPFTMYLDVGDLTEEELLQKAENGVYINSLGGLHAGANPITGDFSLQSGGYMIENGKKTRAVKSFTVAGNFYELLNQITALSNKVELPGFGGMTAYGSPAVLVEGLTIAGK
ncbi:MAG: TldD/PmbA family protein [Oscillospiraceae bacterium]|nr:TldD/PmbA family protein [Oscillospiraceae bacterium]